MKRLALITAVACLFAGTAEAKVKPLTYKQALGVLSVAADDLQTQRAEATVDGDCDRPVGKRRANCYLILKREESNSTFGKACRLDVTVRKKSNTSFTYELHYATGGHRMRAYCAPKS